jgi:uncharacterized HhH-GPD family protein
MPIRPRTPRFAGTGIGQDEAMALSLPIEPEANALLNRDPLALLIGMLLDQQFPMERAFGSPWLLAERLGVTELEAGAIADHDPGAFAAVFTGPPALHRFPGAMAARVQALARLVADEYDGDAAALWTTAPTGAELLNRVKNLPGFGEQKAKIFVALLGKQFSVRPEGWQEAAGPYALDGSYRSIADVVSPESLLKVRDFKKQAKAAMKQG